MQSNKFHTSKQSHFHPFLQLLGQLAYSDLKYQIEYLKVENEILRSKCSNRIRLNDSEKRRIIKFALPLGPNIRKFLSVVNYTTYRRWLKKQNDISNPSQRIGRPRKTTEEIVTIILHMAKNTNLGYTRLLGELKKLHIMLARNTVKKILKDHGIDPAPIRSEDSWDAFIKRTFKTLWASDFFSKTIWTPFGPKLYFVLFFINIHSREVHIAGMTNKPNKQWMLQTVKSMTPIFESTDNKKLIIHDRDTKFIKEFDDIFKKMDFNISKLPYRSPNLNPYAESWVSIIKRECLNHFFVFGEQHLRYLVEEYVKYYNFVRPHSSLNNQTINHYETSEVGTVKCESRLGGLINHYYRE